MRPDINLHGVEKIEARPVINDWLCLYLFGVNKEPFDDLCEITFFMPKALAEEYAAAINAVNDRGREVEGEPVKHEVPYVDPLSPEPANPYNWTKGMTVEARNEPVAWEDQPEPNETQR